MTCKVFSDNLNVRRLIDFPGCSEMEDNISHLQALETCLMRRPLPSLRLDLEVKNGIPLVGELQVSSEFCDSSWKETRVTEVPIFPHSGRYRCLQFSETPNQVQHEVLEFFVLSVPSLTSLITTQLTATAIPLQYVQHVGKWQQSSQPSLYPEKLLFEEPHHVSSIKSHFQSAESVVHQNNLVGEKGGKQTNIKEIYISQVSLRDFSMRSIVESPFEVTVSCSTRPKTGQDERRCGEVKFDTYCSSIAFQLCYPDVGILLSLVRRLFQLTKSLPVTTNYSAKEIIEGTTIGNDQSCVDFHQWTPHSLKAVDSLSFWSSDIDTVPASRHGSQWTLTWRISAECDGFQITLASWPFIMPLARLRIGSLWFQLTRRALGPSETKINLQIVQVGRLNWFNLQSSTAFSSVDLSISL